MTTLKGPPDARLVLTCEHASNALPPWLSPAPEDLPWLHTHWGYDLGAAALTSALAQRLGAPAVMSAYSRLVCDPNRHIDDPTWIRREVEGYSLHINRGEPPAQVPKRRALYDAYHSEVDSVVASRRDDLCLLFSVHSFTAEYEGQCRVFEVGVLFDDNEPLAVSLHQELREQGLEAELNQPYSGKLGLAYSIQRHGHAHNIPYLELEVRQDLLETTSQVQRIADTVSRSLRKLLNQMQAD